MIRPTAIVAAILVALLLIAPNGLSEQRIAGPPSSDDLIQRILEEIQGLRSQIAALEDRVAALESGEVSVVSRPDTATAVPAGAPTDRLMRLEGVETVKADPKDYAERLTQLDQEAEVLQRTADGLKDTVAQMTGMGSTGTYGAGSRDTSTIQKRRAMVRLMTEYETKARVKRGEAARLRRQLEEPRQVITGSYEGRQLTLKTESDLSCVLAKAKPGDFLTWGGWRESLAESHETWVISRLEIVNEEAQAIGAATPAVPPSPAREPATREVRPD